jgi:hypothetical protein
MPANTKKELFENLSPAQRKLGYKRRAGNAVFRDLLFNSEYFSQNGEIIINEAQERLNKRPHPTYEYSRETVKAYLDVTATDTQPAIFHKNGTAGADAINAQTALTLQKINYDVLYAQAKNVFALQNNEPLVNIGEPLITVLGLDTVYQIPYLSLNFAIQFQILNNGLEILYGQNNAILNQNDAILRKLFEYNSALSTIKDEIRQERINSSSGNSTV